MSRISLEQWAMEIAMSCSKRSTCLRRQVGAVLLNDRGHVLSTGYNGVASGMPHCNRTAVTFNALGVLSHNYPSACSGASSPSGTNLDGCEAIHAEQNALLQCRDVHSIATCVVTASPCMTCTKLMLNTSCKTILFMDEYPHLEARDLWKKAGRDWIKYDLPA